VDPRHLFIDKRHFGACVYCGGERESRDHIPPKVFLDEPYPPELPVVDACNKCNTGYSLDEQYLSCFLEVVLCGTSEPSSLSRPKIGRILTDNPGLKRRIDSSGNKGLFGELSWQPEVDRVKRVITKLARGHAAYELYPHYEEPTVIGFTPLSILTNEEQTAFEGNLSEGLNILPELGSRAFKRLFLFGNELVSFDHNGDWIIVQPRRYRYAVTESDGLIVRIVLSEYLACTVSWK